MAPVVCFRPFVRASCAVRSHYFLRSPATLNTAARCCCRCVAATWNPRLKHHLQTAARVQPTGSNLCCSRIEMCCPAQALTNLSVGTTEKTFYLNSYLKLIRSLVGTSTTNPPLSSAEIAGRERNRQGDSSGAKSTVRRPKGRERMHGRFLRASRYGAGFLYRRRSDGAPCGAREPVTTTLSLAGFFFPVGGPDGHARQSGTAQVVRAVWAHQEGAAGNSIIRSLASPNAGAVDWIW